MSDEQPSHGGIYCMCAECLTLDKPKAESSFAEPHGSAAREYWLYAWPEHHYLKGRPSEYSKPPIKIMASDVKEAAQRARDAVPDAIKWELYHGSGWAGNAPLATYMKPLNAAGELRPPQNNPK